VIAIFDSREMKAADAAAIRRKIPSLSLMENAAGGVADAVRRRFPEWRNVVVVCGPGNNGGDGFAAARLLQGSAKVRVFSLRAADALRGDAAVELGRARDAGIEIESLEEPSGFDALARALSRADGVVDALFGTGLDRALEGAARRAVDAINGARRPVIAVDVPSGLSADTGGLPGAAVRATVTVALALPKHCHAFPPARRLCGELLVHDIGIPEDITAPAGHRLHLATRDGVRQLLPPRSRDVHKGDAGRVAIVAGSRGKTGAAVLAARGALRAGAGLVTVLCPESLEKVVVAALSETMTRGLPERSGGLASEAGAEVAAELERYDAAVVGPGLGVAPGTVSAIEEVVARAKIPLVLDADGLNAFAGRGAKLTGRSGPTVLTPHPGEAGRLLGRGAEDVQADRPGSARELARETGACVLLKGEASLVATPDGRVVVNSSGTPLLASAGTGDVLSGVVVALLAAGLSPPDAAAAGAWLHGAAGERLEERLGDAGLLAHEVADAVPLVRSELHRAGRGT
jgi:NAD(P)H-hydrate epimerase